MRTQNSLLHLSAAMWSSWLLTLAVSTLQADEPTRSMNPDVIDRSHVSVDASGRHWFVDEIGFEYYIVLDCDTPRRVYRRPLEQALTWEIHNHLIKISLPDSRSHRPASGVDSAGRKWRRDELGFVYYDMVECDTHVRVRPEPNPERRELASIARRYLDAVDWTAAARTASRNAVVRAMNAGRPDAPPFQEKPVHQGAQSIESTGQHSGHSTTAGARENILRSIVSAAVIQRLNGLQLSPSREEVQELERIIAAGIEDAIIQAFNEFNQLDSHVEEDSHVPLASDRATPPNEPNPSAAQLPTDNESRATKREVAKAAVPHGKPQPMSVTLKTALETHYSTHWHEPEIRAKYWRGHVVSSGWIVGDGFIRQLDDGEECLLLNPRSDPEDIEVWKKWELKYAGCRYAATAAQAIDMFEGREMIEAE